MSGSVLYVFTSHSFLFVHLVIDIVEIKDIVQNRTLALGKKNRDLGGKIYQNICNFVLL